MYINEFFFLSFLDSALSLILRDDKNYFLQIVSNYRVHFPVFGTHISYYAIVTL